MGLIGFIRILKHFNLEHEMKENYVEFDLDILKDFHDYYFDYFVENYDYDKIILGKVDVIIERLKSEEKYNEVYEDLKKLLDKYNKRLEKLNESYILKELKEELKTSKKQKEKVSLIAENLKKFLEDNRKEAHEKFALNNMRSLLYDNYFGQVSFLQKSMANKNIEEHKKVMQKDYINPVVNNLNSSIRGNKCRLCNTFEQGEKHFSESIFVPLGVSNENSYNLFWDFNTSYPVCDVCRLILLCSPAGSTRIYKPYLEDEFYVFVNLDIDIVELYNTNENFKNKVNFDNPYKELILDIVSQAKQQSIWTLQNIFFVEFNSKYESKRCNLNYFHINKFTAEFFKKYGEKTLNPIRDKKFKSELVDNILKNKELDSIIFKRLRDAIKSEKGGFDCYKAVEAKCLLNVCKKKGDEKMANGKIFAVYKIGQEVRNHYIKNNNQNKLISISYRLLNAAKVGNKKDFMDTLIRMYMSNQMEVPNIFLEVLTEKYVDFESIAQAFISGLISGNMENVKEVVENE